jgi:outer membrane lipoprotein-sorting protein
MRRLLIACALFTVGLAGAACSGPEAMEAQQLLQQSQAAQAKLTSATYEAQVEVTLEGRRIELTMGGGAYLKGPNKGDQFLSMSTSGLPTAFDAQLVSRGGRYWVRLNGTWQSIPMPAGASSSASGLDTTAWLELARYVKDVRVTEGRELHGERVTTVTGVIDTAGLIGGLSKLSGLQQQNFAGPDLSELRKHMSDIHAVLFVSDRTLLIRGAVLTTGLDFQGHQVELRIVYRLLGVNKPVEIPQPS